MAVINDPNVPSNVCYVGNVSTATAQQSQHVTNRPLGHGNLGHYRWSGFSGILPAGLAANSEIFQFRWSHATYLAVIMKVRLSAAVSTTFFAAGVPIQIDIVKSSGWSAAGTGGTSPTLGSTCKMRTSMASSSIGVGDLRMATTAALGAGTKTLEANSLGALLAAAPITASLNGLIIPPATVLWEPDIADGQHPLVLGGLGGGNLSEGFSVRSVAVPTLGTWTMSMTIDWAEVPAF